MYFVTKDTFFITLMGVGGCSKILPQIYYFDAILRSHYIGSNFIVKMLYLKQ